MHNLYKILERLDLENIHYSLGRYRESTVTIHISVPGERIEFDVESDGSVLISNFQGHEGDSTGMAIAENIIKKYSDQQKT